MSQFFDDPILNSPYAYPAMHWELVDGQPTEKVIPSRRRAEFITPIPKPKKRRRAEQQEMELTAEGGFQAGSQAYDPEPIINELRRHVDDWRALKNPRDWQVTPETARLLEHWRHHRFEGVRPFFCQVEAVETAIWLTEVAPKSAAGKKFRAHLENANTEANPELSRLALKLATGAGKTTVMAMLIAWQTINAVRRPNSKKFTKGFLVVTPGITIRDRLRVLLPNDTENYYTTRELVPSDMVADLLKAKIVITNYHAFKLRERMDLAKGTRAALEGPGREDADDPGDRRPDAAAGHARADGHEEHPRDQRRGPPLLPRKAGRRRRPDLKGDEKKEAEEEQRSRPPLDLRHRSGQTQAGRRRVIDLSATPFFLRGSGYAEGTLFPWTMSDFSLMDAIECGIVKLPRVPVADNIPGGDMPMFRNLWEHIRKQDAEEGRGKRAQDARPGSACPRAQTALDALYGHYEKTYELWEEGWDPRAALLHRRLQQHIHVETRLRLHIRVRAGKPRRQQRWRTVAFRCSATYDEHGNRLARPRTLLIDSEQLESGDALDKNFRDIAGDEIERFRREIIQRRATCATQIDRIQELLREVMNTVGKPGRLGESIRCVVSVSMLTEGWDANTVTHVLGVRAFGTQLLCEQVIGRALRRQSYDLNEEGKFNTEYADVLGIPFDFTAKPVVSTPGPATRDGPGQSGPPRSRRRGNPLPPRVEGYRVEMPEERLEAEFTDDSVLGLTPTGGALPSPRTKGIIGEGVDLTLHTWKIPASPPILFHLTKRLLYTKYRDPGDEPELHLFGQLKRITRKWMDGYLRCKGGTYPAMLLYQELADMACERITHGITRAFQGEKPIKAMLDPYNPTGSTNFVNFTTSKELRWETDSRRCHVNWVVCDSSWEADFCRVLESHDRVRRYVKNQGLGLEVPTGSARKPANTCPTSLSRSTTAAAKTTC